MGSRCKCGGSWLPLKKDLLPLLSMCNKCHAEGPFWADVVNMDEVERLQYLRGIRAEMESQNWGRVEESLNVSRDRIHFEYPGGVRYPLDSVISAIQARNYGEAKQVLAIMIEGAEEAIIKK